MRINRFLARAGVSSRRGAEELVRAGRVTVNGRTVTRLATTVDPEHDTVELDGSPVTLPETFTTIILNKPRGVVVTMDDPQGRPTVADLTRDVPARVVPVGRLDADSEGLLIMTDDGTLAHRIAHPSFELDKVYEVTARGVLQEGERRRLEMGVELDGRTTSPASVTVMSTERNRTKAVVTIHEGRKRQVRRMFETVGHPVRALRRVRIGPVELGDLRPASWRRLSEKELNALAAAVGLDRTPETPCSDT
ncbi:MAG: pseudouridine synthase [Candidatus Eisenbacteria bacterium]|nr:pseudouridine synthase [Candidatus Eisenbacteria bacterium]